MDLKPKPSDLRRDFQKSQEILGKFKTWTCNFEYSAPTTGNFDNNVYISLDIKAHRKISHFFFQKISIVIGFFVQLVCIKEHGSIILVTETELISHELKILGSFALCTRSLYKKNKKQKTKTPQTQHFKRLMDYNSKKLPNAESNRAERNPAIYER